MGNKPPKLSKLHPRLTSDNDTPSTTNTNSQNEQEKIDMVLQKLKDNEIYRSKLSNDVMQQFASILCDKQELMERYLPKDFLKTQALVRLLPSQKFTP
jgi:hypothetical protein